MADPLIDPATIETLHQVGEVDACLTPSMRAVDAIVAAAENSAIERLAALLYEAWPGSPMGTPRPWGEAIEPLKATFRLAARGLAPHAYEAIQALRDVNV